MGVPNPDDDDSSSESEEPEEKSAEGRSDYWQAVQDLAKESDWVVEERDGGVFLARRDDPEPATKAPPKALSTREIRKALGLGGRR